MRIAIFTSATGNKWALFVERHQKALQELGIEIGAVVLDDNTEKKVSRFRHAWKVARRQAMISRVPTLLSLSRIVVFKYLSRCSDTEDSFASSFLAAQKVNQIHVDSLNSSTAVEAVRANKCDLVCLMGTRIISRQTLEALEVPVINIHSSDPRIVRGGPPVIWEILQRRSHITLTVHEVVQKLDAGAVLRQVDHPINYSRDLGRTIVGTMWAAKAPVTDLFFQVIVDYHLNRVQRTEIIPGKVHVTPSICETLRAAWLCRRSATDTAPRFVR
jgi:Formyl transferase